jgi:hypothetical protein
METRINTDESSPIVGRREGKVKKMRRAEFGMRNNGSAAVLGCRDSKEKFGIPEIQGHVLIN